MSDNEIVIRVQNLSKQYRLGEISTGTLSRDLQRWWNLKHFEKSNFEFPYPLSTVFGALSLNIQS
jgi:hypothetical protein